MFKMPDDILETIIFLDLGFISTLGHSTFIKQFSKCLVYVVGFQYKLLEW